MDSLVVTLLDLKATHGDEASHDTCIQPRSTEHLHEVTTTRNTLYTVGNHSTCKFQQYYC